MERTTVVMLSNIMRLCYFFICNMLTTLINTFIWRDKNIWLFGSWMGERFADNPRFLFQYLHDHKEQYGIVDIIWVTRNKNVFEMMCKMGYKVFMMHSFMSVYYHFKAGVHVICNMYANSGMYTGDIMGQFSLNATKIDCWHGIAIKACGAMTNLGKRSSMFKRIIRNLLNTISFINPGAWNKRYVIATSEENARTLIRDMEIKPQKIIVAGYPRLMDRQILTMNEKMELEKIKSQSVKGYKIILYLPTFRANNEIDNINPLKITGFVDNLYKNKFIWIEKKHFASSSQFKNINTNNIITLNPNFDVNILFNNIDLLITDYSSAAFDAIYKKKRILSYIPDYDNYSRQDRGFVNDYDLYFPGIAVKKDVELFNAILETLNQNYYADERRERYMKTRRLLYKYDCIDMKFIFKKIIKNINC